MVPTIKTMVQLLDPQSSTNFLRLKFPLICNKIARGEHVFCLDSSRLAEYFDVRGQNVAELSTALCDKIIPARERLAPKKRVDPVERARQYRRLLENGVVKNQSELAAYIGVSRAWVSRVMSILKKRDNKDAGISPMGES